MLQNYKNRVQKPSNNVEEQLLAALDESISLFFEKSFFSLFLAQRMQKRIDIWRAKVEPPIVPDTSLVDVSIYTGNLHSFNFDVLSFRTIVNYEDTEKEYWRHDGYSLEDLEKEKEIFITNKIGNGINKVRFLANNFVDELIKIQDSSRLPVETIILIYKLTIFRSSKELYKFQVPSKIIYDDSYNHHHFCIKKHIFSAQTNDWHISIC